MNRTRRLPADRERALWGIEAVMDYNPTPHLDKIKARLMAINSGDYAANPAADRLDRA